ncbi:uncharacterized protein B0H64DRAFT_9600 [Chaetomium fimeti]|uniref:Uncharacterized protein n=1 Tax=Chaetomium fimeti TaxID=1854472 RepID=A0AAE0HPB4_9PEZI|nr:hypothetical protein B0H64DRAFT_9600 [Chaetomium fimeti]
MDESGQVCELSRCCGSSLQKAGLFLSAAGGPQWDAGHQTRTRQASMIRAATQILEPTGTLDSLGGRGSYGAMRTERLRKKGTTDGNYTHAPASSMPVTTTYLTMYKYVGSHVLICTVVPFGGPGWVGVLRTGFHHLRGASDAALEQARIGRVGSIKSSGGVIERFGDPDVSPGIKNPV